MRQAYQYDRLQMKFDGIEEDYRVADSRERAEDWSRRNVANTISAV